MRAIKMLSSENYIHKPRLVLCMCQMILLNSCATISAVTLPEVQGEASHRLQLSAEDCVPIQQSPTDFVITPALVDILYNKGTGALKGFIEEKADRFTAQYTVTATIDDFSPGTCLRLQRLNADDGSQLMNILLEVRRRGVNSMEIVPASVSIQKFAASTSPVNGISKARVTVSVGLSFINSSALNSNPVTELNLPVASAIYEIGVTSSGLFSGQTSKLFPDLSGRPVNVAVTVSEAGNGSDVFEDAVKGFDENAAVLKTVLGEILSN